MYQIFAQQEFMLDVNPASANVHLKLVQRLGVGTKSAFTTLYGFQHKARGVNETTTLGDLVSEHFI